MTKKSKEENICTSNDKKIRCCKVESIISVDERGQTVIPKHLREKANIRAGDKLAVMSYEKDEKICCISLIKVEDLTEMVKDMLGPMMKEIISK